MAPLGLIAGEGVFPLLVARGAREAGRRVVCAALGGHAWADLEKECDSFRWVGLLRMNQWVRTLRSAGCREAIMVGRVDKTKLYDRRRYFQYLPDTRSLKVFLRILRDKRPQAILQTIVDELDSVGITLIDSTRYCGAHLATPGVMTRRQPSESQWQDVKLGYEVAQAITRMDVGQCVAVRDRDVIAVEAVEGTNAMIERAGKLCRLGGWTLAKVSNMTQDMRVDVPSVGTTTIEKLAAARAGCIVLEAGKTILLEKQKVLELADRHKIAVVGWDGGNPA